MPQEVKSQLKRLVDALEVPSPPALPARPPMFESDPLVVGSPELGRLVHMLLQANPELRPKVKSVVDAPTARSMRISRPGAGTRVGYDGGLYGLVDDAKGEIGLNPYMLQDEPYSLSGLEFSFRVPSKVSTLVHELAHTAGQDEQGADRVEDALSDEEGARLVDASRQRRQYHWRPPNGWR